MHCHLHRGDWNFHLTNEKKKKLTIKKGSLYYQNLTRKLYTKTLYAFNQNRKTIDYTELVNYMPHCTIRVIFADEWL